ncbi:MAG: hypothetical protein DMG40_10740 [Acidobacteria bacterium]|nr:MAG: hypothetical protein DMG40_10740 [Acidobacteriota bacterium]
MQNVLRKKIKLLLVLLVFSSLAWAAAVPWKGKPYDQWDDKDIQRVFTDSPWARKATVTRTWPAVSQEEAQNPQLPGSGKGMPGAQGSNEASASELEMDVYWASSRVMRAASARRAILHGGKTDVDVDKYASQPQEEYQIVIQSEDMTPFVRHDEKFFQANSFLEPKKSKQKIAPSHVVYERGEKSQVSAAVFFFPKKTASGEPTIGPDEKSVEFNCKIEGSNLRVNFEPLKMIDNQGPAL